jgi:hypothetical protein
MTDLDALLVELRAGRERLLAVVAGVGEEQFKRRPTLPLSPSTERGQAEGSAGDWSIAEVLAHLLAAEQRRCVRIEAMLRGEELAPIRLTEDERNAEARQGRTAPVPQVIHGLLAARRRLERALSEADAGPTEDVARLVRDQVIAHEDEHRAQIEAVKQVLGAAKAKG